MLKTAGRLGAAVGTVIFATVVLVGGCARSREVPSRSPIVPPPPPKDSTSTVEAASPGGVLETGGTQTGLHHAG